MKRLAGLLNNRCCHEHFSNNQGTNGRTTDSINLSLYSLIMKAKTLSRRIFNGFRLIMRSNESLTRINIQQIDRLVFVCRGNVCRSPYAEEFAKSLGLSAISCGIDVSRSAPAETMAVQAALLRGKDLSKHMSRSIYDIQLDHSDCLVVMDLSHLAVARYIASQVGCQLTLIGMWRRPQIVEIADPYGQNIDFFIRCFNEIDDAISGLAEQLNA